MDNTAGMYCASEQGRIYIYTSIASGGQYLYLERAHNNKTAHRDSKPKSKATPRHVCHIIPHALGIHPPGWLSGCGDLHSGMKK